MNDHEPHLRAVYRLVPEYLRKHRLSEQESEIVRQTGGLMFEPRWVSLYEKATTIDRSGAPEDVQKEMKRLFQKELREFLRRR